MPIIHLKGRVLPEFVDLSISNLPQTMEFRESPLLPQLPLGLVVKYTITVSHSMIDIKCDAEPYNESLFSWVVNRASTLLHGLIDLYCFTTGVPLAVILDSFVTPGGEEKRLLPSNPHLVGISSLQTNSPSPQEVASGNILAIVVGDTRLMASLRDLITAIGNAGRAAIDCSRAIEGLRMILEPNDDKRKEGWHLLRCQLNLSEDYIRHITKASEKPRHGNREYISGEAIDEITTRSWMIMNRFLKFSSRGGLEPLPLSDFPLL